MIAELALALAVACLGLASTASGQAAADPAPVHAAVGGSAAGHAGAAGTTSAVRPDPLPEGARLIVIGAALTDTVCALGDVGRLLATDDGGRQLQQTAHLPSVGYARTLSAEGLLALRPDALLAGPEAGPPAVLEQLAAAGLRVVMLPLEPSEAGACERIRAVAHLLGRTERGEQLVSELQDELAALRAVLAERTRPSPRVLFVYARSTTSLHAAGAGTPAESMLALAGASNALVGFDGYAPLTPEAAVSAAPEAIVLPARSLELMGGLEGLREHPGLALTPALRDGRVIALDELLLLGFGPRTGQAARQLAERLDPQLAASPSR